MLGHGAGLQLAIGRTNLLGFTNILCGGVFCLTTLLEAVH